MRGGDDTLDGGTGSQDTVTYSPIGGTSYGGAFNGVTVDLGAGTAHGDGDDTLSSFEIANGSPDDDTLIPAGGGSTLQGGFGNDTLVSGPTATTRSTAAAASDTVDFSANGVGGDREPQLGVRQRRRKRHDRRRTRSNASSGRPFNDTLTGDANANMLDGQGGNDTLAGGGGDDDLLGGGGRDTADFASSLASVTVSLAAGTATGQGTDTLDQIENVKGSGLGDR